MSEFDWENPFTAANFYVPSQDRAKDYFDADMKSAELANARFREILKQHAERVYSHEHKLFIMSWTERENTDSTHSAFLIGKKELK